jgi:Protein of unknown function (DUF3489)
MMSHRNILKNIALPTTQPNRTAKRRKVVAVLSRPRTKQEIVLGLLKHRKGTTIAAIMNATGWQDDSVRSFFVTIVLKKLGLTLSSETVDRARVYRVTAPGASKPSERSRNDAADRCDRAQLGSHRLR